MIDIQDLTIVFIFLIPLYAIAIITLVFRIHGSSIKVALKNTIKESLLEVYKENAKRY